MSTSADNETANAIAIKSNETRLEIRKIATNTQQVLTQMNLSGKYTSSKYY